MFWCRPRTGLLRIIAGGLLKIVKGLRLIMADLSAIKDAVSALDAKVTAHLDADGAAVLELANQNAALQQTVADLTAQLAAAGASPEDIAAVVDQVNAVANRL